VQGFHSANGSFLRFSARSKAADTGSKGVDSGQPVAQNFPIFGLNPRVQIP